MSAPTLAGWSTSCFVPFLATNVRPTHHGHLVVDLSLLTAAWWAATKTDLSDVTFTDVLGNQLTCDVMVYNRGAKTGTAYVRYSSVPASGYAPLYAWSGNSGVTVAFTANGTVNNSRFRNVATRFPEPHEPLAELWRCYFNDGDTTGSGGWANRILDRSPFRSHGLVNGTFNWTTRNQPGWHGQANGVWDKGATEPALTLGANSGYVSFSWDVLRYYGYSSLSWMQWVYLESSNNNQFLFSMADDSAGTNNIYAYCQGSGLLRCVVTGGSGTNAAQSSSPISTGAWHLLGFTCSPEGMEAIVDGVVVNFSAGAAFGGQAAVGSGWASRTLTLGGDNRSGSVTPNTAATTFGAGILTKTRLTAEEIAAAWEFRDPIHTIARRKSKFRGYLWQPASNVEQRTNQEVSIAASPSDPDGFAYTATCTAGYSNPIVKLAKTNDLRGEWKSFGYLPMSIPHASIYIEAGTIYFYGMNAGGDQYVYTSTDGGHTWSAGTKILDHTAITGGTAITNENFVVFKPGGPLGPYVATMTSSSGGKWSQWNFTANSPTGPFTVLNGGAACTTMNGGLGGSVNFRGPFKWVPALNKYIATGGVGGAGTAPDLGIAVQSADLVAWTKINSDSAIILEACMPFEIDQIADPWPMEIVNPITGVTETHYVRTMMDNNMPQSFLGVDVYPGPQEAWYVNGTLAQATSPTSISAPSTPVVTASPANQSIALGIAAASATFAASYLTMTITRNGSVVAANIPYSASWTDAAAVNGTVSIYSVVVSDPSGLSSAQGTVVAAASGSVVNNGCGVFAK